MKPKQFLEVCIDMGLYDNELTKLIDRYIVFLQGEHGREIMDRIRSLPILHEDPKEGLCLRNGGKYWMLHGGDIRWGSYAIPPAVIEQMELVNGKDAQ